MMNEKQSSNNRMSDLSQTLRDLLIESCESLLIGKNSAGIFLSGGVDTGAVLAACKLAQKKNPAIPKLTHAVTVFASEIAPDRAFSQLLANQYGLIHHQVNTSSLEILDSCLVSTVRSLESFDPMTIRNSLVIEKSLEEALKYFPDIDIWLSGDASDELLGGYSFTWKTDEPLWSEKRNKMCGRMTFAADALSKSKNMIVRSPYRSEKLIDWVVANCTKEICIGERDLVISPDDEPKKVTTGKIVLRDAFPEVISSKRRKDPIEIGSGITELGLKGFFSSIVVQDEEQNERAIALKMGIRLRDLEQIKYFQCFRSLFLPDDNVNTYTDGMENMPKFLRLRKGNPEAIGPFCLGCGFQLYDPHADFCLGKNQLIKHQF